MILAQNPLRRLSGNNGCFAFFVLIFLFACDASKKAIDPNKMPSASNQSTAKVDTIKWTEDTMVPPPIKSDKIDAASTEPNSTESTTTQVPSSERLGSYNVSVLFPFYSDRFNPENDQSRKKSMRAIQVFGGMQLAVEKLEQEGLGMKMNIYDTKGRSDATRQLFSQSDIYNSDVIFGPFRSENLKIGANIAKQIKKPFISPMNPSNSITSENPFYVQVKPSLNTHCEAITNHVLDNYSPRQVVIVARDKSGEKQRMQLFQKALANYYKGDTDEKFREYLVSDFGNEFENMDFQNYIIEGLPSVFIVPSWSSESFINNVLRKLRLTKGENEVVVYGMPQWAKFERIGYDYYDVLNVHISSDNQLDKGKENIQNFAKAYFYKFGEAPTEDAYYGYDMLLYFGRMLNKHGSQFQAKIDSEPALGLSTGFDFQSTYDLDNSNLENAKLKYIENKHVDILEFKDYYFQLAEPKKSNK